LKIIIIKILQITLSVVLKHKISDKHRQIKKLNKFELKLKFFELNFIKNGVIAPPKKESKWW
jgi:hypothetical protein